MHFDLVSKTVGLVLMVFSVTMLPPVVVAMIYQESELPAFLISLTIILLLGWMIWFPARHCRRRFQRREGILAVVSIWLILAICSATPFLFSPTMQLSITDAFFESMSGLTTTGATVLSQLDSMSKSILFYRQQLQWLGGIGIVVLAVAILPMLGVGGMDLFQAESTGVARQKLTPKLVQTAKALWHIYLVLTLACALGYYFGGMSVFDAISHSFSTVAIGGFSTHDASLGYFDSIVIEAIAMVFMLLAGVNFSLHYLFYQKKQLTVYWRNSEFTAYTWIIMCLIAIILLVLFTGGHYEDIAQTIRNIMFHAVSIATTTGFVTDDFHQWPIGIPILLILASFIGACAGSTGGGIKVARVLLIFKLGIVEIKRFLYPHSHFHIKLNATSLPERTLITVFGFLSLYILSFLTIIVLLLLTGLDGLTAFSATAATLNNLGPGLGDVAANYQNINSIAKWILATAMLLGRLEVLSVLALLHKTFWRY